MLNSPKVCEETQGCFSQEPIRLSVKEEAQFRLDRQLHDIEQTRKLIKFTEKFPDAVKYLEENKLSVYCN